MAVLQARQVSGSRPVPLIPAVLLLAVFGILAWQWLDASGDRTSAPAVPSGETVRRSKNWDVPANLSMAVQLPGWWMQSCEEPPCIFASMEDGPPVADVRAGERALPRTGH